MGDLLEEIIINLRAIIISSKGGLDISRVNADYRETFGVDIPLSFLGCQSVKELLQNNPDNFKVSGTRVEAVTKSTSNHIVAMIRRQKSKAKKRNSLRMMENCKFTDVHNSSSRAENISSLSKPKKKKKKPCSHKSSYQSKGFRGSGMIKRRSFTNEELLYQFCVLKGLMMPSYSISVRKSKHGGVIYDCELRIGSRFWVSTYPSEIRSEIEAKELASKKAILLLTMGTGEHVTSEVGHVLTLKNVCWQMNLPEPVFNSFECRMGNSQSFFISEIFIGRNIFNSSYPAKASNIFQAQNLVAKKVIDYLKFGCELLLGIKSNYA